MNSQFGTSFTIKEGRAGKWRQLQIRVENVKNQSACAKNRIHLQIRVENVRNQSASAKTRIHLQICVKM